MIIQNKRTSVQETISLEQWNKMGEVQLQKYWIVIDKGEVDLKENLTIEKFLNPEKKSVPDVVAKKKK